jgi:hypothetical protein
MLAMSASRMFLLPQQRPENEPPSPKIRHYRLARLRLVERRQDTPERFAHLRRAYD